MSGSDETVPGGRYIVGGYVDPDTGTRMGGTVRDANGRVLEEFDDDEENTGAPATLWIIPTGISGKQSS